MVDSNFHDEAVSGEETCDVVALIQRERDALLFELGTLTAKFELTLRTLSSILGLDVAAGWVDILESCEILAAKTWEPQEHDDDEREALLRQADAQIGQLEEKVQEQSEHIARMKEFLGLFEQTNQLYESQMQETDRQAKRMAALEARDAALQDLRCLDQETLAAQERHVAELSACCMRLQAELNGHQAAVEDYKIKLRVEVDCKMEMKAVLARKDEELLSTLTALDHLHREASTYQRETAAELDRRSVDLQQLAGELADRNAQMEKMAVQLHAYEDDERRRYSYRPDRRLPRSGSLEDIGYIPASDHSSVCSGSARLDLALTKQAHSEGTSAAASPLPSARSSRGKNLQVSPRGAAGQGGQPPPLARSGWSRAAAELPGEEHVKFLAQFPMASRTERSLRDGHHGRRVGPKAAPSPQRGAASSL